MPLRIAANVEGCCALALFRATGRWQNGHVQSNTVTINHMLRKVCCTYYTTMQCTLAVKWRSLRWVHGCSLHALVCNDMHSQLPATSAVVSAKPPLGLTPSPAYCQRSQKLAPKPNPKQAMSSAGWIITLLWLWLTRRRR